MGYGPFIGSLVANVKHKVEEVELPCEFTVKYELTFSDRKLIKLMNVNLSVVDDGIW